MGNIHLDVPDDLHRELKLLAAKSDTTLKELFVNALTQATQEQQVSNQ